jgi:large subunit ribosomal protein L10
MALTKAQKAEQLEVLKDKFSKSSSIVFTHYSGMTVHDVSALRKKLKEAGAEMKVAKKTLMEIAAKEKGFPELPASALDGPVACIFSFQDPIAGAQVAFKFAKDHPQISFLGGVFEGKLLSQAEAKEFAQIPGRQVLLAIFAGMIRSPLQKFASICSSPLSGFARSLAEIAKKKAAAPAA